MELAKAAGEFNYAPARWPLRYGQARRDPETFFEATEVTLLRRTQNLAVQDAFLECLEDAGIDTSEFREGTSHINNYGIINSGSIGGEASTAAQQRPREMGKKAGGADKTGGESAGPAESKTRGASA